MSISPVTIRSAALTLAYMHAHRCPHLPGRGLANRHLRRLAAWLGYPRLQLRTVRSQPVLAAHLTLLTAAELLTIDDGIWLGTPRVFNWLRQDETAQRRCLLTPFTTGDRLDQLVSEWNLAETLPVDFLAYVQQHLRRPVASLPQANDALAAELPADAACWRVPVPARLPIPHLFHLLQLGDWMPGAPLICTPLTIGRAIQRGYSLLTITMLLETAVGARLTPAQAETLHNWDRRGQMFSLQPVQLLTTSQPQQMGEIMANRRLRDRVHVQLSPRHAVVSTKMQQPLRKWLARQQIPLNAPQPQAQSPKALPAEAYASLALQVLAGLGELIELPLTLPAAALDAAGQSLTPAQQAELAHTAAQIVDGVKDAIRGRDAFFPAADDAILPWLEQIEQALLDDHALTIAYQSPADKSPRSRRIQPLRLEQRGELVYLHAYCYLAERNLTFRLDRIHQVHVEATTAPAAPQQEVAAARDTSSGHHFFYRPALRVATKGRRIK